MAVITWRPPDNSPGSVLRFTGAFVAVFSLAVSALVLFAIPGACSAIGGIQLVILGLLFIMGIIAFLTGTALSWRKGKS